MLRKLFGFPRTRKPRAAEAATRAPAPWLRRKPLLEPLESRLLLSADPVGVLDPSGVLALQLTDGDDMAVIERIGESATGGDIVAVTLGAVTQQYGDAFFGIVRLLIDAGAGDDWLRIIGVRVTTDIIGGLGTDTFEWQNGDTTWSITAPDTGHVETLTFTSFEHLVGADGARDTFVFAAGASVSGSVQGGDGGGDAVVIQGGEYQNVVHDAVAPGAGTAEFDGARLDYTGMESVTVDATVMNLILNGTAGDDDVTLRYDAASGRTLLEDAAGAAADFAFVSPHGALIINLGDGDDRIKVGTLDGAFAADFAVVGGDGRDQIGFDGAVATHGHDLEASAETIVVGPGSELSTGFGVDGAMGDAIFAAADTNPATAGAANTWVTVVDATVTALNIVISARATSTVDAAAEKGESRAAVEILGDSALVATMTLTIEVHSLVSSADAAPQAPASDAAPAGAIVESTAAARIGGGAVLAAGDDLAIDVTNTVDLTGGAAPAAAAIVLDTAALVEDGATLVAAKVNVQAASEAAFAAAALVDFAATTRAEVAAAAEVSAGAVLVSAAVVERAEHPAGGEAAIDYSRLAPRGPAGADNGARGVEALWPDGPDPVPTIEPMGYPAANGFEDGFAAALHATAATARLGPDGRETAVEPVYVRLGEWLEHALARDADPNGGHPAIAEFVPDAALPLAGALMASHSLAGRSGPTAALLPAEAEADARNRRSPVEGDPDDDAGDTGLGASLVFSVLKDSTLAELARSVGTSGGTVVLSAGSAPFARSRARSGPEGADPASGGALEIAGGELAGAVVVTDPIDRAGDDRDLEAGLREALRSAGAADLVLATAARHDLIAEAGGGAEPGTAVTPTAPIDVAAAGEDDVAADGQDTFTLPAASGVGDDDRRGDVTGLVLSTDLAPLEYEVRVGSFDDAIRSGDGVEAFAGERVIAVSGMLDPASRGPAALAARASGADVKALAAPVAAGAAAPIGESREVVMAYLGTFVAPIAASTGLARAARRDARGPGATRSAGRAASAHRDAFRAGGEWAETFVNELGVAPDDQQPNTKIKIKL